MANQNAYRDENDVPSILLVDDVTGETIRGVTDEDGNLYVMGSIAEATVPDGGTGLTSLTPYAVLTGGTTSTSAMQQVSGLGTSGQVLTSNGAGALPTWQSTGGGAGTVTDVSVVTANGVSGSVANSTTTPAITLTLGAITPTTVNKVTLTTPASGSTLTIADGVTFTVNNTITIDSAGDKTLGINNSLTFAGTDSTTMTFPAASGTVLTADSTATVTNKSIDVGQLTGQLAVANGGTGAATLTANNVILGNGTSAVQFVAPGTSGNVLTSNGTTWTSAAPASGGTARRNLNLLLTVAQTLQYGTTPVVSDRINGITCVPAASSAAQSVMAINPEAVANLDFYDQDPEINITAQYSSGSGTGNGRFYFGDIGSSNPADGNAPVRTLTTKSMFVVGITSSGTTTFYAVNASGTTNTNTALTGITASDVNHWRVVADSGTNIKYYCNYTLKATHTTNLPSGDNAATDELMLFGVGNDTGDSTSRAGRFGFLDVLLNSPTG